MTSERDSLRSSELPLQERLKNFDKKYEPEEIESVYAEMEDGSRVRYTAYAIAMDGKGVVPSAAMFLLDAASVGDKVWTTLKIDHSEGLGNYKENLVVLERKVRT